MKLVAIFTIFLFAFGFTKPDFDVKFKPPKAAYAADSINFIIIFGESNATGQAPNFSAPSNQIGFRAKVQIQRNQAGGQFENLNIANNSAGGNNRLGMDTMTAFGMELAIANQIDSGYLQNPTYIAKICVGGTDIANWLPGGTQEPNFRSFLDSAFAQMNRLGPFRVFVWESIGINDQGHGTLVDSFVARMGQHRAYWRTRYGRPDMRFLETRFSNSTAFSGGYNFAFASAIDGMRLVDGGFHSIPCDQTTYIAGQSPIHWDRNGLGTIAHNMLDTMLALQGSPQGNTGLIFSANANNDYFGPGRGSEQWQHSPWDNTSGVNIPAGNSTPGPNYYTRFAWKDIESDVTQGSYSWTEFDRRVHQAMDAHQAFSFGVMPICSGCGAGSFIPTYLHNLLSANGNPNLRDWFYASDGAWIPNWNNPDYISRYQALLQAIANHIANTSYKPAWSGTAIPYTSIIDEVDIRGYGNYGEWHQFPWVNDADFPSFLIPTQAALDQLIDMNLGIFSNFQNQGLIAAFGASASATGNKYEPPTEVGYRILTGASAFGAIGWRRDNWGDPQYSVNLENNSRSYNPGTGSVAFNTLIMNKYKMAPITGEPLNGITTDIAGCGSPECHLPIEVNLYHATSFGNGNLATPGLASTQLNMQNASRISGYNVKLTSGTMTTTLTANGSFNLHLNWSNTGLAPPYNKWRVDIEARQAGSVKWSGTSSFSPRLFLPGTAVQDDNFVFGNLPVGNYDFYLIIRDPLNYRLPMPLMIPGRGADGAYLIRAAVPVTAGGGPVLTPPVAQINGNSSVITLPVNQVTVDGSSSYAQVGASISSYLWTVQAGAPNTPTNSTPTSSSTIFGGLIAGNYTFKLQVTDNRGLIGTATYIVTVNPVQVPPVYPPSLHVFSTQTPPLVISNDGQPIELGMKFRSSVAIQIVGIRFYKVIGNNGTHIGELYTGTGTRLAAATFVNETASGWQEIRFAAPVTITPGVTYIAAYFSPGGFYVTTDDFFNVALVNGVLTGLAAGTDGPNGVYKYTTTPAFPTDTFLGHTPNYWVDVSALTILPCQVPYCIPRIPYKKAQ